MNVALRRLGLDGPAISWFSIPVCAPLRGRFGEVGSVLYYQDRYDAFSHVNGEHLRGCLREFAAGCDVSIASSEALAEDLRRLGAEPHLIAHGVDAERFAGRRQAPEDLAVSSVRSSATSGSSTTTSTSTCSQRWRIACNAARWS